jgi:ABC-type transporter Mla MlaB component
MVAENRLTIRHETSRFSYLDACRAAERVHSAPAATVLVDLAGISRTTTGALARLVVLRRQLLDSGRDLRVLGLQGQPRALCEFLKLTRLLCEGALSRTRSATRRTKASLRPSPAEGRGLARSAAPSRAKDPQEPEHLVPWGVLTAMGLGALQPCSL